MQESSRSANRQWRRAAHLRAKHRVCRPGGYNLEGCDQFLIAWHRSLEDFTWRSWRPVAAVLDRPARTELASRPIKDNSGPVIMPRTGTVEWGRPGLNRS